MSDNWIGRRDDLHGVHLPHHDWMRFLSRRFGPPLTLITEHYERPHDILERLRREDPDAHALLIEHLIVPASVSSSPPQEKKP